MELGTSILCINFFLHWQALVTITAGIKRVYDEFADEKFCALLHAQILSDFSEYNRRLSSYSLAYKQQEQALNIRLLWLEENTVLVAQSRLQKATVLFDIGGLVDAELLVDQTLRILRHRFDDDFHPLIAAACSLKCEIDVQNGKHNSAKEMAQLAKKATEVTFFDNHSTVVHSVYLTGLALHASGRYRQTERMFKDAIYRSKKMFGQYSIMSARSSCAAAESHIATGNFREASTLFREALAIQERVLGTHHPHYIRTLTGLAMVLHYTCCYSDSISYFETANKLLLERDELSGNDAVIETHRIDIQNITVDVPVRSMWMLARAELHNTMGEFDEAADLYRKAVNVRKRMYGSTSHPAVLEAVLYEAENWRSRGQNTGKLGAIYEENVHNMLNVYGDDHPHVIRSRQALNDYLVTFDNRQDDKLLTKCRADLIDCCYVVGRCEGAKSLRYASVCSSIGMVLLREGQYDEAKKYFDDALRIEESCLGKENAVVADTLNRMAILCIEQEQWEGAESHCMRALDMYKEAFGVDHPKTINCKGNLGLVMISAEHTLTAGLQFITEALQSLEAKKYSQQHPWMIKFRNGQEFVHRLVTGAELEELADEGDHDTSSQHECSLNSVEKEIVDMEILLVDKDNLIKILEEKYEQLERRYKCLCDENGGQSDSDERHEAVGRVKMLEAKLEDCQATIDALEAKVAAQFVPPDISGSVDRIKELEAKIAEYATMEAAFEVVVAENSRVCDVLRTEVKVATEAATVAQSNLEASLRIEAQLRDKIKQMEETQGYQVTSDIAAVDEDLVYELKEEIVRLKRLHRKCTCGDSKAGALSEDPVVQTPMQSELVSQLTDKIAHLMNEVAEFQVNQCGHDDVVVELKERVARLTRLLRKCKCGESHGLHEAETLQLLRNRITDLEHTQLRYVKDIQNHVEERDRLLVSQWASPRAVTDVTDDLDGVLSVSIAAMKHVGDLNDKLNKAEAEATSIRAENVALKAELEMLANHRLSNESVNPKISAGDELSAPDMDGVLAVSVAAMRDVEGLKAKLSAVEADRDSLRSDLEKLKVNTRSENSSKLGELETKLRHFEDQTSQLVSENDQLRVELARAQATVPPAVVGDLNDVDMGGVLAVSIAAMKHVGDLNDKLNKAEAEATSIRAENVALKAELEMLANHRLSNESVNPKISAGDELSAPDMDGVLAVSVAAMRDVEGLKAKLSAVEADRDSLRSELESVKERMCVSPSENTAVDSSALEVLVNNLKHAETQVCELKVDNDQLRGELEALKAPSTEDSDSAKLLSLSEEIIGLQGMLQAREADVSRKNDEIEVLQNDVKRLAEQCDLSELELRTIRTTIDTLTENGSKTAELMHQLVVVQSEKSSLEKDLHDTIQHKARLEESVNSLNVLKTSIAEELSKANATIAILTDKVEVAERISGESAELLESLKNEFDVSLQEKDALLQTMIPESELSVMSQKYEEATVSLENVQDRLNRTEHELVEQGKKSMGLECKVNDLEAKIASLSHDREVLKAEHDACSQIIADLEAQVEADKELQQQYEEANASVLDDLNRLQNESVEDKSLIAALQANVKTLEENQVEADDLRSRLEAIESSLAAKTAEVDDVEYQLKCLTEELTDAVAENNDKSSKIDFLNRTVEGLKADNKVLEQNACASEAAIKELEAGRAALSERILDLEVLEKDLRAKIEYAKSQKQSYDPWGFSKEAQLGFRRFKAESRHKYADGADSSPVRKLNSAVRRLASTGNVSEPDNDSSAVEDEPVELSKHVDELLKGSVPSRNFVAAKGIVGPEESGTETSLPDITKKLTFADYIAASTSLPPVEDDPTSNTSSDCRNETASAAEHAKISPRRKQKHTCRQLENDGEFKLFFGDSSSHDLSDDECEQTSIRKVVSNDAVATPKGASAGRNSTFSNTAPLQRAHDICGTSTRAGPNTERRVPKKKALSPLKFIGRSSVYGCIDTERDLHMATAKLRKSSALSDSVLQRSSASLDSPSVNMDFSQSHRSSKKPPSELNWDSRFQMSPFDPRTVPHMWPDDTGLADCNTDDGLAFGSTFSVSVTDQDSVATTLKRKELGLY